MEKFLNKKYAVGLILILIVLGAFFVRAYNLTPWLYFKMDQARDAFLIARAVENGPGDLPLLGARAGATEVEFGFLRLGPIYYYFQYLSGAIFDSTAPQVFAYPDLFFGIMVLPMLYLLARIYLDKKWSLAAVFLYAFCFLAIEYSRFAWNPNPLPFFAVLSFWALLKFLNPDSGKEKRRKWHIMLWALGLAVGSQLHFLGFFSLVGVSGLLFFFHYEVWKKTAIFGIFKKSNLKKISLFSALAAGVFILFYLPWILSDSMNNWENSQNFIQALSSKPSGQTLFQKIRENVSEQIKHYALIICAYIYPDKFSFQNIFPLLFSMSVMVLGFFVSFKNFVRSKIRREKDFIMLIFLWLGVFFVLCIPLAYQIRPRFFLFTLPVPFLLLGIAAKSFEEKKIWHWKILTGVILGTVFIFNFLGTLSWFLEMKKSQEESFTPKRTLILKTKDGVTLSQLQKAAQFIGSEKKDGTRIYFYVKPEHVRPMEYLLSREDPKLEYQTLKINDDPLAQYFAVLPTDRDPKYLEEKFGKIIDIIAQREFGQIKVLRFEFEDRMISSEFRFNRDGGKTDRLFWSDVFGQKKEVELPTEGIDGIE